MEFLGMNIGQGEIKMDERKLEAIKEWKPPHFGQRNPVVLWVHKLLQEIHPRLLQHHHSPEPAYL